MSPTYILFALCAVFIVSTAIVLWKKGYWLGLAGACATFLAGAFAVRYDCAFSQVVSLLKNNNTLISFLILLVTGSFVFGAIASKAKKAKFYFDKKKNGDKIAYLLILLVMTVFCLVVVKITLKVPAKGFDDVKVIGETTPNPNSTAMNLSKINGRLDTVYERLSGMIVVYNGSNTEIKPNPDQKTRQKAMNYFWLPVQISLFIVYCLWCMTGAWIASDAPRLNNVSKPAVWIVVISLAFPLGLALALLVPIVFVDALLPVVCYLVPALIYACIHNKNVPYDQKVLTKAHFAKILASMTKGKKKKGGKEAPVMTVIDLSGYGKNMPKDEIKRRTEVVRSLPGYTVFSNLVNNALLRRATHVQIAASSQNLSLKYFIDGLWMSITDQFNRQPTDQEIQNFFAAMRAIIGGAPEEKKPKMLGQFFIEYDKRNGKKKKMAASLAVILKPGGEEATIQFERIAVRFGSFEKMRVGAKRAEQIKNLLKTEKGMVVFAAPPGQGLRTLTDVSLCETDLFTRDASAVEDVRKPYMFIENVVLYTYDSGAGQSPISILPDVFFREPRLLIIRDMVNKESFQLCCEEILNDRLIVTTVRTQNSAQAIMALLKTGIDPKLLADSLTAVVSQKLLRSLCPSCKQEIPATAEMCKRLGIPPGRVKSFFRKREHKAPEPGKRETYVPCPDCMDTGYKGLIGMYDVIVINDEIRQVMTTKPSEEAIRRSAMKSGGGTFMIDGARLVAEGLTSYEELSRVLGEGKKAG